MVGPWLAWLWGWRVVKYPLFGNEKKRPLSSLKGAEGMIDLQVVSGDLAGCESNPR